MLMHQDRPLADPLITPENQDFFIATKEGKFLLRQCNSCGQTHYYPRNICPMCGSDQTEWRQALGQGRIYSYSVLRKGVEISYCIAYVALPEGVTVLTNIVDCDFDQLSIGQAVKLCFKPSAGGAMLPMFTPA
jgi:uncharacterized protein